MARLDVDGIPGDAGQGGPIVGHDGGYRHRVGAFRVDETPEAGQTLLLVLRATNGPGWEDPGAVYV